MDSIDIVFSIANYVIDSCSMVANGFVFSCIVIAAPKFMRSYNLLVFNSALIDVIGGGIHLFLQPQMIIADRKIIFVATGLAQSASESTLYAWQGVSFGLTFATFVNFLMLFAYRLRIMSKFEVRKNGCTIPIIICVLQYAVAALPLITYLFSSSDSDALKSFALNASLPGIHESSKVFGNDLQKIPLAYVMFGSITFLIVPAILTLLYVINRMKKPCTELYSKMSPTTRKTFCDLVLYLKAQTLILVLFVALPVLLGLPSFFGLYHSRIVDHLIGTLRTMLHAVSPMVTVFFVTPYNAHFKKMFCRCCSNSGSSGMMVASISPGTLHNTFFGGSHATQQTAH